ncbi:MAG: FAD-dependent oxidoreductase [Deltaproteobacteria bacterium]|nr:FAD-dependent oxidoreductase [Deltaproteobacteria bacterium]
MQKKRIVIVGGVAGGASAAARARRLSEDAEIILIDRGPYVSFANCGLPYHIGGVIKERNRLLVQTPQTLYANLCIDVRTETEVMAIDRSAKQVTVKNLKSANSEQISYDQLILSPGAEPIRPLLPGSDDKRVYTLRSMTDMDGIISELGRLSCCRGLIIGGGYIGLEMAEAFIARGLDVSIVELAPQVMAPVDIEMANIIHQQLRAHGVDLRLETSVSAFEPQADKLIAKLDNGEALDCGLVIMAIGVRPETKLAKDCGLELGERGGIKVNEYMCTSDADIYAVGDAVEVKDFVLGNNTLIPLAGPATRQGRIAADNIFGRSSTYKGTQGTAVCKVFDLCVAMTGASEKLLKRLGREYQKVYIHPANHAGYYPGATQLSLKLLFEPSSGKILGAQAVGMDGVEKRIDVIAMAIRAGLTVLDLEDSELCYAPPYGSAKDPVNYAGFVASNALRQDVQLCQVENMLNPKPDQILLDVRTAQEVSLGSIPGALNISLQELRDRHGELPKDKELLVFCQVGLRGYLACRILRALGYKAYNLSGGYKTYKMFFPGNTQENIKKEIKDDSGTSEIKGAKANMNTAKVIDCMGLQCPGPIMKVAEALKAAKDGEEIEIHASDAAFCSDIQGWCASTGNKFLGLSQEKGTIKARIVKGGALAAAASLPAGKKKTIVVFNGDFDRCMAAFIIANGAASMGSEVTMFFTFWGLNALRKSQSVPVKKNIIEQMFGWMMPRGADKLTLSKMNMAGIGLDMIKGIMRKKNVQSLAELISAAQKQGVKLVACSMSMDLMGLKKEEFIDGVEEGGVAMYLSNAEQGNVNLFI